ncbi:MAG: hypothetical protein K0Q59_99 [Paenibacillus sp.]|jgi:hypothetical protein|nr:hypothetical protein [Paenibacillus sp.]
MRRRIHPFILVILVLMVIGIMNRMMVNPFQLIMAIVIFGGVFLLWKFPPARWRKPKQRKPSPSASSAKKAKEKRKDIPFRVIQGGNKRDDDDPPERPYTYH